MSNPYLEKAASLYDYWKDLTGSEHSDLKARKAHLERALANGDTPESLSRKIQETGARTFKARAKTGGGLLAAGAASVYGAHKYSEYQADKARDNLVKILEMQKKASLLQNFKPVISSMAQVSKATGKAFIGSVNKAHGGGVKEFAYGKFGGETPDFKKFIKKSPKRQQIYARVKWGKPAEQEFKKLKMQQRVNQVGVYGTAAAGVLAYNKGKEQGRIEASGSSYY